MVAPFGTLLCLRSDMVFIIPLRFFWEPCRTSRSVLSSLCFFLDFWPLAGLIGVICEPSNSVSLSSDSSLESEARLMCSSVPSVPLWSATARGTTDFSMVFSVYSSGLQCLRDSLLHSPFQLGRAFFCDWFGLRIGLGFPHCSRFCLFRRLWDYLTLFLSLSILLLPPCPLMGI